MTASRHRASLRGWLTALAAIAVVLAGCTAEATKAGGGVLPASLTLGLPDGPGLPPYLPDVERFADLVHEHSDGAMIVEIRPRAVPWGSAGESELARLVADGAVDLALVPTRAFGELGMTRFAALDTPFLITSDAAAQAVSSSGIARAMLDDVGEGRVGLALFYESVRRPAGYPAPLRTPEDFAGARIRVPAEGPIGQALRAFGAEPVRTYFYPYDDDGVLLTGAESAFGWYFALPSDAVMTVNLPLATKFVAIVVAESVWDGLDDAQRAVLSAAAEALATADRSGAEEAAAARYCRTGRMVVFADEADAAVLRERAAPVVAELAADPQTGADMAAIDALVAQSGGGPPDGGLALPEACGSPTGDSAPWPSGD